MDKIELFTMETFTCIAPQLLHTCRIYFVISMRTSICNQYVIHSAKELYIYMYTTWD